MKILVECRLAIEKKAENAPRTKIQFNNSLNIPEQQLPSIKMPHLQGTLTRNKLSSFLSRLESLGSATLFTSNAYKYRERNQTALLYPHPTTPRRLINQSRTQRLQTTTQEEKERRKKTWDTVEKRHVVREGVSTPLTRDAGRRSCEGRGDEARSG
ncbi:hypothetical protein K0M31_010536 [Melipona bicolor]|uniref:Uncharacterized protein n=1 Tax=Melipona bicolor TaxID=60889 RepID=A0AA40FLC7_9HYME|nr:hypothetical protein K0M31_010536 [Melipona bicolor]